MKQEVITAYFEDIARRFKPISHSVEKTAFKMLSDEKENKKIASEIENRNDWFMLLEPARTNVRANNASQQNVYRTFSFTICIAAHKKKSSEKEELYNTAEFYALAIFKKIVKEQRLHKNGSVVNPFFQLCDMDLDTQVERYYDILSDSIIGVDAQIKIKLPYDLSFEDETLW